MAKKTENDATLVSEEHETEEIDTERDARRGPSAVLLLVLGAVIAFGGLLLGGGVGYVIGHEQAENEAARRERAYLGVAVLYVDEGALIHQLDPAGPAEEAGLLVGDIIQRVEGEPVRAENPLERTLLDFEPGDEVEVAVLRGGEREGFLVELDSTPPDGRNRFARPEVSPRQPVRPQFPDDPSPYVGVVVRETDARGLLIEEVLPASPAARAGLLAGDVILEVDGETVRQTDDLRELIEEAGVGGVLEFEIRRDGERMLVELLVGTEFPPSPLDFDPDAAYLGVQVERFTIDRADELGMPYPGTNGALVVGVIPESPARRVGLRERDVILSVDNEQTTNVEAFVEAIQSHEPGDVVRLTVFREDQDDFLDLEVALGTPPGIDFFTNPEDFPGNFEDFERLESFGQGNAPGVGVFAFTPGCPPSTGANDCL